MPTAPSGGPAMASLTGSPAAQRASEIAGTGFSAILETGAASIVRPVAATPGQITVQSVQTSGPVVLIDQPLTDAVIDHAPAVTPNFGKALDIAPDAMEAVPGLADLVSAFEPGVQAPLAQNAAVEFQAPVSAAPGASEAMAMVFSALASGSVVKAPGLAASPTDTPASHLMDTDIAAGLSAMQMNLGRQAPAFVAPGTMRPESVDATMTATAAVSPEALVTGSELSARVQAISSALQADPALAQEIQAWASQTTAASTQSGQPAPNAHPIASLVTSFEPLPEGTTGQQQAEAIRAWLSNNPAQPQTAPASPTLPDQAAQAATTATNKAAGETPVAAQPGKPEPAIASKLGSEETVSMDDIDFAGHSRQDQQAVKSGLAERVMMTGRENLAKIMPDEAARSADPAAAVQAAAATSKSNASKSSNNQQPAAQQQSVSHPQFADGLKAPVHEAFSRAFAARPEQLPVWSVDLFASMDSDMGETTLLPGGQTTSGPQAQTLPGVGIMKQMPPGAAKQLADQVGLQIGKAASEGLSEFTIRINPAELGRVTVKLAFGDDGTLRASIMTERPETLQALQRESGNLERALGESSKGDLSIEFSLDERGGESAGKAFAEAMHEDNMKQQIDENRAAGDMADSSADLIAAPVEEDIPLETILAAVTAETGVDVKI